MSAASSASTPGMARRWPTARRCADRDRDNGLWLLHDVWVAHVVDAVEAEAALFQGLTQPLSPLRAMRSMWGLGVGEHGGSQRLGRLLLECFREIDFRKRDDRTQFETLQVKQQMLVNRFSQNHPDPLQLRV